MKWMSIDPGQKHVGVALWHDGYLGPYYETTPEKLLNVLCADPPELIVIEAFSLMSPRYNRQAAAQAVDTIKLIGKVHGLVYTRGTRVIEQQPAVRHVATASPWWRDLAEAHDLGSNPHSRSAIAHGVYYLRFGKGADA